MDTTSYTTITRQSGLLREMQVIANNIANMATTGYRQEGLIFTEFVSGDASKNAVSMATARARNTSLMQGTLSQTGGKFDFAIEGDGFFLIDTPQGERGTRNGAFSPDAAGVLVTAEGNRVLDAGGAPIFVPNDASALHVASDGTISAGGREIGQIGLFTVDDATTLTREDGVMFASTEGFVPAAQARVAQGFLESSNVNPILQIARMIEVQRAYEMGQSFMEAESQRTRSTMESMIK